MVVPRGPTSTVERELDFGLYVDGSSDTSDHHVALAVSQLVCPFAPSAINPQAAHVHRASLRWTREIGLARSEKQHRELDRARIAWVEARAFPSASREVLQLATDWTTLFCLLDDSLETERADPLAFSATALRLLAAFQGSVTRDLPPMGAGLADVRRRIMRNGNERFVARFAAIFKELLGGFLWEGINRWKQIRPNLNAYRTMRQITVGLRPQFLLGEIANGIELSDRARNHPDMLELQSLTCSLVGCVNDIFTCTKEFERDSAHNAVFILLEEESLSWAEVLLRLTSYHDELMTRFQAVAAALPNFRSENEAVERFVDMLKACIRGHLDWARETGRYTTQSARGIESAVRRT